MIERHAAKRIVNGLAQSGQPPKMGASLLNVGTDEHLLELRAEYLEDQLLPVEGVDGGGGCKWVEADFGNGKTQFLRCMQEHAWDLGYVTAFVDLSNDECPLDQFDLVYSAVARVVQAKPTRPADLNRQGIDVALEQLLDRMFPGVFLPGAEDSVRQEASNWIRTVLAEASIDSLAFRSVAGQYLLAKLNGDGQRASIAASYLRGEELPTAARNSMGVREQLDRSNGFMFLRSMCQLLQRTNLATGTILLFDEARQTLSLMSSRNQKKACENLVSVINRCNAGDLPGTLFLYAVMPEFFTGVATHHAALLGRCGPRTRINVDTLQGTRELDFLLQIGGKIMAIYRAAYDDAPSDGTGLHETLKLVADRVYRRALGAGTRRLFVRTWVTALDDLRHSKSESLTKQKVDELISGAKDGMDNAQADDVLGEGE